jgi:hypothetical protein
MAIYSLYISPEEIVRFLQSEIAATARQPERYVSAANIAS